MVVSNSLILLLLFYYYYFFLTSNLKARCGPMCFFFLQWLGPKSMQKPPWCRNPSGNRRSCANVVCVCFGKACCGLLLRGSCWACCGEVGLWIAKRFAWQTAKCRFSFCWLFKTSSTLESATIMRVIKMKWSWPDWKDTWSPPFASCLRLEAYQVRLFSCDESCQKRDPSAEVSWRSRDVEAKLWIFGRVWKCATMIPSFFFSQVSHKPTWLQWISAKYPCSGDLPWVGSFIQLTGPQGWHGTMGCGTPETSFGWLKVAAFFGSGN